MNDHWKKITLVALGLVSSAHTASAGGGVRYEYDKLDRLTLVEYPDGTTVAYTYDAAGNIISVVTTPPPPEPPKTPPPEGG